MQYVLASVKVPDQERQYYAGPIRKNIQGRMADKVTHLRDLAAKFNTREEAEAMRTEIGDGFIVEEDGL